MNLFLYAGISEDGMDVSTAPHSHPEPHRDASHSIPSDNGGIAPPLQSHPASPLRHALLMGFAATASVVISFCCLLSVASRLGPGHWKINLTAASIAVFAGIYVGIKSWKKAKEPRPASRGRCPDCGRDILASDNHCSLCGRAVTPRPVDA